MDKSLPLKELYEKSVVEEFKKKFGLTNSLAVPRPVKVIVNIGVGKEAKDKNKLEEVRAILRQITGQEPVYTRAKKSVAEFQLRKGDINGIKVTLRKKRMWDFLDKLVKLALPRVKDFRGINPNAFDKDGNYTLGLVEYLVFPEVDPAKVDVVKGVSIVIVFSGNNPEQNKFVMEKLGFIFKEESHGK